MKNIKWFIQDTNLKESEIIKDINSLSSLELDWQTFGVLKDNNNISGIFENDFNKSVLRCSIKVLRILDGNIKNNLDQNIFNKLKNGISYNYEAFDQEFYIKNVSLPFLNKSSEILTINSQEELLISYNKDMFIKPTNDQKCFIATILPAGKSIGEFIKENNISYDIISKEKILINDIINIKGEYRFICIKDEIVGYSKYLEKGKLDILGITPSKIIDYARDFCREYNPSDIYTMDLCELDDGSIKVVEYNCWNCSGLYNIDRKKLFSIINDYKIYN